MTNEYPSNAPKYTPVAPFAAGSMTDIVPFSGQVNAPAPQASGALSVKVSLSGQANAPVPAVTATINNMDVLIDIRLGTVLQGQTQTFLTTGQVLEFKIQAVSGEDLRGNRWNLKVMGDADFAVASSLAEILDDDYALIPANQVCQLFSFDRKDLPFSLFVKGTATKKVNLLAVR